tara:strand:- start:87 stop:347 length:261 start_codon:yes stop_codon:yes gene_type:complete
MIYDFAFLTDKASQLNNEDAFWFKVSDIFDLTKPLEVNNYLIKVGLFQRSKEQATFANETLFKLWQVVHHTPIINYYLEKKASIRC